MNKYIVLLRGINVGGNNKIPMKDLKEILATEFSDVITYLNTGNIILKSEKNVEEVGSLVHQMIQEKFELDIFTLAVNTNDYLEMMDNLPDWFGKNKEDKHNLLFVLSPYSGETMIEEVGAHKPEYESIAYFKNFIFWTAPLKTFGRTRWSKIVGTKAYKYITIRNFNTATKLAELSREE